MRREVKKTITKPSMTSESHKKKKRMRRFSRTRCSSRSERPRKMWLPSPMVIEATRKGMGTPLTRMLVGRSGVMLRRTNGVQMRLAVACADPQLEGAI